VKLTKNYTRRELIIFSLACMVFVSALTVANFRYAKGSPGGNDFIPRWLGTRMLLMNGDSPYSPNTTQAIQDFIVGGTPDAGKDQYLFAYPLYSIVVFFPFALIGDYLYTRAFWLTTLQVALVLTAWLGSRLARWRLSVPLAVGMFLYALLWYYSVRPMINGNAAILVGLFLVGALIAIRNNYDLTAGILLALSTIKPQAVILFIPLILIWSLSHRRWKIIYGTLVSTAVLILLAILLEPGWPSRMLEQVRSYPGYTPIGTPVEIFSSWWPGAGLTTGWIFSGLAVILILITFVRSWKSDFNRLVPAAFLVLAATNFTGIATATSNHSILFPGLLVAYNLIYKRLGRERVWSLVLLAILFLVGIWILFFVSPSDKGQPPIMYLPLPLFLISIFLLLKPELPAEHPN